MNEIPAPTDFSGTTSFFNFHAPSEPPEIVIPPGAQLKQLKLEGMNTILQIYLPAAMDSFAHWDADCCTGGSDAYAYWHNAFPHVESNLGLCFPKYYPDSIFQITVLVQLKPDTIATWLEASLDAKSILQKKYNEAYNTDIDWKPDTLEWIYSHPFAIVGFEGFLVFTAANEKGAESLFLFTIVEGRHVTLLFEFTGTDFDGFREKMLPYARTIRFLPDP